MTDLVEPLTLPQAKQQLRVTSGSQDDLISDLLIASREYVEGRCGHLLARRQVTQQFPAFAPYMDLTAWPIASIDSVTYVDGGYVAQPLDVSGYDAAYGSRPARLTARGYWPRTYGPVTVAVTAGYAAGQVPQIFRQAVKVALTGFFMNRDGLPDEVAKRIGNVLAGKRLRRL